MSRTIVEEEKLLRARTVELQASNIRLRELDALKTKLLSTVSHELRTPITAILASAKIIGRFHDERPEAVVKFRAVIVREAERLARLLDSLLDLAKIESGVSSWDDTNVEIGDLLDTVVATMEAWGNEAAVFPVEEMQTRSSPFTPELPAHNLAARVHCGSKTSAHRREGSFRPIPGTRRSRWTKHPCAA